VAGIMKTDVRVYSNGQGPNWRSHCIAGIPEASVLHNSSHHCSAHVNQART
jgi:hypothetical protein